MKLPKNMVISNLAESIWSNTAKQLKEDVSANPKLTERLNALIAAREKEILEHKKFKRQALRNMVDLQKKQSINVFENAPRTNAWNQGDYKRIREPALKKRKKKALNNNNNGAEPGKRRRKPVAIVAPTNLGK